MAKIWHEDQPDSFLITQTGAELFAIDRDFYFSHAPQDLKNKLQSELVNSYPSEAELLNSLQHFIDWQQFKKGEFDKEMLWRSKLKQKPRTI